MSEPKTQKNNASVLDFINSIEDELKKQDSLRLLEIYKDCTGEEPAMWGSSIVGYGTYHYKSKRSNQEGDWPLAGFSPRKQSLTLYVMVDGLDYSDLLDKLGKHKESKACLYINKLSDVNVMVLKELIKRSYEDSKRTLT